MRLALARLLMRLPRPVWRRLPDVVSSWAVDQWLWSTNCRHLYPSAASMRAALDRQPSRARRVLDALDPGDPS